MWLPLLIICVANTGAEGNYPVFDYRTRMRVLLLPADLKPGSVVYRLRGTDAEFDYPLTFSVADEVGKSIIRIENMPCNPTHTYCQANVFLAKKLDPDRIYDMILSVKDSTGHETKVDSTIKATRATSHFEDIFPHVPTMLVVSEATKVGTVLAFVLARKNPSNSYHSYLELWGSEKFRIVQNLSTKTVTNGSIILTGELDFEEKNMYSLNVFCLDPFTNTVEDTRNIAGFQLPVLVEDDQDMPPEFNSLPPVTKITRSLQIGEKVLRVQAQDGDRGSPRSIKYTLINDGSPITSFFNISESSGDIVLARPLEELAIAAKGQQPMILTVSAEELKTNQWESPAMMATTQVALLLDWDVSNSPPYFKSEEYTAKIQENAPQGSPVIFSESSSTLVLDDDSGKEGVFSLTLENNNGTFEIFPSIGEQKAEFGIRVRNNEMLDFEKRASVYFTILAKEVTTAKGSDAPMMSRANVTVYLDDQNDNSPVFLQETYEAEIPENITKGTIVTQVQATDADTGVYGKISYTNIIENVNHSLTMDPTTGVISVGNNDHIFDREVAKEYRFIVEAQDMEGLGNKGSVPLVIRLLDVNDETPRFERETYEFILQPSLKNFTSRAFIKATDRDAEEPNNIVRYEIISGNYGNKFSLNEVTGELSIRDESSEGIHIFRDSNTEAQVPFRHDQNHLIRLLTVRAYDLGIPHRWTKSSVRIYPPGGRSQNMNFIVSGSGQDRDKIEELLRQLTGGQVSIRNIKPYTGYESGTDLSRRDASTDEKSVVSATVFYDGNSYSDFNQVEKKFTKNKTESVVEATATEYKNENRTLLWLLIFFLLLLFLILLFLTLCCIWKGCCVCPWLESGGKITVSPSDNINFIQHEKLHGQGWKDANGSSYYGTKEAWSGSKGERTIFYDSNPGREKLTRSIKEEILEDESTFRSHSKSQKAGPNIIYTKDFIETQKKPTMVIEDVEINPYSSKPINLRQDQMKFRLQKNSDKDPDSDSLRKHEIERGSDLERSFRKSEDSPRKLREVKGLEKNNKNIIKEYRVVLEEQDNGSEELEDNDREGSVRDQYYIRDGNAEILRLVTRGNVEESLSRGPDKGKDLIMKKFMDDQKQNKMRNTRDELRQELLRRIQRELEDRNSDGFFGNSDLSESVRQFGLSRSREMNSNYDTDITRFGRYNLHNQETQSLPGHIEISTQTERDFGTQTEELKLMRPPKRRVRSDNEFSDELGEEENGDKSDIESEGLSFGRGWMKGEPKKGKKKSKAYKMRTPILEERESELGIKYDSRPAMFEMPEGKEILSGSGSIPYTENKSSILRRRKMKKKIFDEEKIEGNNEDSSDNELKKEKNFGKVRKSRRDIENNGNTPKKRNLRTESLDRLYEAVHELEDSELLKIKMESKQRATSLNRFYNALTDLDEQYRNNIQKTSSLNNLKNEKEITRPSSSENVKEIEEEKILVDKKVSKIRPSNDQIYNLNETRSQEVQEPDKRNRSKKSKYMDWYSDLNKTKSMLKKKKEDDMDSGIAMSSLTGPKANGKKKRQGKSKTDEMLEKKSVFSIAYDGVKTKVIRPETNSSEKC